MPKRPSHSEDETHVVDVTKTDVLKAELREFECFALEPMVCKKRNGSPKSWSLTVSRTLSLPLSLLPVRKHTQKPIFKAAKSGVSSVSGLKGHTVLAFGVKHSNSKGCPDSHRQLI